MDKSIGKIISGKLGEVIARKKSNCEVEIGELLIANQKDSNIIYQVTDLFYGSQISSQNLELISGISLEEEDSDNFLFDENLRNYDLVKLKPILSIKENSIKPTKTLSSFFSDIRKIKKEDFVFFDTPKNKLLLGKIRSGSQKLDVDVYLKGDDVFSHHMLVCATTGKGKSVLIKNILWNSIEDNYCGHLVFDPHDEYYGRNGIGLKDHPSKKVSYYSMNPPQNTNSLIININVLRPAHFFGVVNFSDAQSQALSCYYKEFKQEWIKAAILQKPLVRYKFDESTLNVVSRKLSALLEIKIKNENIMCDGVFKDNMGDTTINEIIDGLIESKTVIVDTSNFSGSQELLISSIITTKLYDLYKLKKKTGEAQNIPIISIVLEEAPRVIGKEVLSQGQNIFGTIAREGRKFKIGLVAITQLPSLIPREILANMNTKIILGMEMGPERNAIIESSSQDLSDDSRNIASLDKGEAIITSNFSKFAIPIKIPFFDEEVKKEISNNKPENKSYSGIKF